ncbi:MAG: hybrid sensor histidine kinase/response regulator [Pseudanabaena frigida]|uniref:histidine kinase n=1 Tax=Pseudanabaena frigida TaxID=945775 RepID=A0A2W4Y0L1_9CYAN|nr:MAG: hybrid sensor histidine kinase/response regulator [Pseudanabaena frigida]
MKRILVIEDNPRLLEDIQDILTLRDFHVITAQNGTVGVNLAKEKHPDLILCDVMMPELDGFGVLKALRLNSLTAAMPVVFLTAKADHYDIREGMNLGADDYLTKPFTVADLMRTIQTRIEKYEIVKKESAAKLDSLRLNIAKFLPHELLTPLHGILGMSELLLHNYELMTTDESIDSIRAIYNSGQRLHRLMRNFILFSELEVIAASSQTWRDVPVCLDIKDIIGLVAHTCAESANRVQDLELDLEDAIVKIASKHFTKVIEEIVENAFKFSKAGNPVRLIGKVDGQFFRLNIIDCGRGMTNEQIANIGACMQFDREYHEQQGSGLGLIIAKRIVELYGGEFSVEYTHSKQTSVCIKLPTHNF